MEDGVYIVNRDYDVEYANKSLIKEFGSYQNLKCFKYLHDEDEACPWCKNQKVFEGKSVRWQWYSDKTKKNYDLIDSPLYNPDGTISKLEIFRDITSFKKVEKERKILLHMYGERIKELTCLYEISKIFERKDLTLNKALQMIVDLIPPAWQYPSITCARITFKDYVFKSKDFIETRWKQSAGTIDIDGLVEVFYKEEMAELFEGPFLKEERALLNVIAERISGLVEKYRFIELINIFDKYKNRLSADERSKYLMMAFNRYLDSNI
jgi:hypothetical protein